MIAPRRHTIAPPPKNALKGPIEEILRSRSESPDKDLAERGMTIGELVRALDIDKTRCGDVSATLHKIRNEGKVFVTTGPATSAKGPRFVKRYRWRKQAEKKTASSGDADDRRFLSLCR